MCSMTWYESFHTIFLEIFFDDAKKTNDFHTVKILHLIITLLDEKTHHRDAMLLLYVSMYAASAVFIFHDIFMTFVCGLKFVFPSFFFGVSVFHEMSTHSKLLCVYLLRCYLSNTLHVQCYGFASWLLLVIYVKIYSDEPKRPQKLLTDV